MADNPKKKGADRKRRSQQNHELAHHRRKTRKLIGIQQSVRRSLIGV